VQALDAPFPDTPCGRWLLRIGHYAPAAAMVFIVCSCVTDLLPTRISNDISRAYIPFVIVIVYLLVRHNRSLCVRCVAGMPLDGDTRAARPLNRTALHLTHLVGRDKNKARLGLFALVAASTAVYFLGLHWLNTVLLETGLLALLVLWRSLTVHQRLQPWCPWCRGPGGDSNAINEPGGPPGRRLPVPSGTGAR
jgi:hypothetical protein